uniref:DNA-directed RNA polymerases I, II, and III subunit RPABC3 n=1 Tax=Bicosoecida sp. CB-2014 TaxID=1486930 RepID=A0A7S1CMR6_9STRA|mmetsp:Transcript_6521/g.23252  ORF Transcript_6521/g.23252 Transcript_6521/m.23252 type:complete len:163 (+) Transcript_6521:221-709(+)
MAERSATLFHDIFTVDDVNPDGKKFDRVSRLVCKGETWDVLLKIDVASEVFPVKAGEKLAVAVVSTLRLDGEPDDGTYQHNEGEESLLDQYDYGMHGRVFKYDYEEDDRVSVYASFGGLLMLLHGQQDSLSSLSLDQRVYCLIRRPKATTEGGAAGGGAGGR